MGSDAAIMKLAFLIIVLILAATSLPLLLLVQSPVAYGGFRVGGLEVQEYIESGRDYSCGKIDSEYIRVTVVEVKMLVNVTIDQCLLGQNNNTAEVQTLRTQDPQFDNFANVWLDCMNELGYGNGTIVSTRNQCVAIMDEAVVNWCGVGPESDPVKCKHASNMTNGYIEAVVLFDTVVAEFEELFGSLN
jgi:hypothetical protein